MHTMKRLILAAASLLTTPLFSALPPCCDPCGDDACCMMLGFEGELLNWRARKCGLDYAIPFDDIYNLGDIYSVHPGWNGGFRVGVFAGNPNVITLGVRYTDFRDHTTKTTIRTDAQLAATRLDTVHRHVIDGEIQYAQGRYDVSFDLVDIEAAFHSTACNRKVETTLFGGFKLAMLDQKFRVVYAEDAEDIDASNIDRITLKSNMDAYGLYVGGRGQWNLCGGLALFGKASVGALVGGFDQEIKVEGQPGGSIFVTEVDLEDNCKRVITNFDLSVGGQYSFCGTCNSVWILKIGYDFSHWFDTLDFSELQGVAPNNYTIKNNVDGIGFDGLFVSLEAIF